MDKIGSIASTKEGNISNFKKKGRYDPISNGVEQMGRVEANATS